MRERFLVFVFAILSDLLMIHVMQKKERWMCLRRRAQKLASQRLLKAVGFLAPKTGNVQSRWIPSRSRAL